VEQLVRDGVSATILDLADLPADDLLGRTKTPAVEAALAAVFAARILIVGTPVYRASYSGLLKVFFDLFPQDALAGKIAILIATGAGPAHYLVVDHALRPLLSSVGALVVSTGIYGTDAQFGADGPHEALTRRVDRAVDEAREVLSHVAL
jgi:FMN reductase